MDAFEELTGMNGMDGMESGEAGGVETSVSDTKQVDKLAKGVAKEIVEKIKSDEAYKEIFKSRVNDLKVVNTLGFSDEGDIVSGGYDSNKKNKNGQASHIIVKTAMIVGYNVQNVSDSDIQYTSVDWTKGEDGKFVQSPNAVTVTIKPGETVAMTKKDFFILTAKPEFSNEFSNGVVTTRLSVSEMSKMDFDDVVARTNISMRADENGNKPSVHSDEFKVNISEKDKAGKWFVKPEYEKRFGFLNNEKERKERTRSAGTTGKREKVKLNSANVKAAFIAKVLADANQ